MGSDMKIKKLLEMIEVTFWKAVIPLMSETRTLSLQTRRFQSTLQITLQDNPWLMFMLQILVTVALGMTLGVALSLMRARMN